MRVHIHLFSTLLYTVVACAVLASIGCGVVGVLLFAVLWVVAPASEVVVCVGLLCALMGSLSCVLVFGCNLYADLSMAASAVVVSAALEWKELWWWLCW